MHKKLLLLCQFLYTERFAATKLKSKERFPGRGLSFKGLKPSYS
jgi:hypothetical protein